MSDWDDRQYLKFADERTRPAHELLARVPLASAERVVDMGCGPGNSTTLLAARFPEAKVVGVDSSSEMLARARRDHPMLEWVECDLRRYRPERPLDLLFANAVMHWLPEHATLFPSLLDLVRPGGVIAVQMPRNFEEPSHRLMREIPGPFARRLQHVRALTPVQSAAYYYDLLAPLCSHVDIWQTTYEHVMDDVNAIVEWVRGTGLRPYLDALTPAEQGVYLEAYTAALDDAYPARTDKKRLFTFPRLFFVATR
ncbi:MAG: trans-aconitate 2-methyltransferase [Myxococcota bacterium]